MIFFVASDAAFERLSHLSQPPHQIWLLGGYQINRKDISGILHDDLVKLWVSKVRFDSIERRRRRISIEIEVWRRILSHTKLQDLVVEPSAEYFLRNFHHSFLQQNLQSLALLDVVPSRNVDRLLFRSLETLKLNQLRIGLSEISSTEVKEVLYSVSCRDAAHCLYASAVYMFPLAPFLHRAFRIRDSKLSRLRFHSVVSLKPHVPSELLIHSPGLRVDTNAREINIDRTDIDHIKTPWVLPIIIPKQASKKKWKVHQ